MHCVMAPKAAILHRFPLICRPKRTGTSVYMATVSEVRSNPTIRAFYPRLRANGKHAKPELTACMRKLLVNLNAMLHNKTSWETPALTSSTSVQPAIKVTL